MLLFVNLIIYFSARRYFKISTKKLISLQVLFVLIGMLFIFYFKSFAGEFVFGTFIIFAILLEFLLWRHNQTTNFKLWVQSLIIFILGFIFWLPDAMELWCDPTNYINGRSVFHLFTSAAIYLLYRYYSLQDNNL